MPTKGTVQVQVDERLVAVLPPNRFTWVQVPHGRHVIAVGYPSFPDTRARLVIETSPGKDYLIHYDSKRGTDFIRFDDRREPEPGVTPIGRGGFTRVRQLPSANLMSVVQNYRYVPAAP